MKKIITVFILSIYLVIVITTTIYVLNINKYNLSVIGNYSFIPNNDNSLTILDKNKTVNVNDEVYYYDTYGKYITINKQKVINKEINNEETIYTLENKNLLSYNYLIGNSNGINIPILGSIIKIISSTLGYLIFIVLPILFTLIYFTYKLRMEIKNAKIK